MRTTKKMEGDNATGALLLQDYNQVFDTITALTRTTNYACIHGTFKLMIEQMRVYQAEAL